MKNQIIFALALVAAIAAPLHAAKESKSEFNKKMRELWADHGVWTREFVISAISNNTDAAKSAARRLMKNQEDIGMAIVPFYGINAGKKLTALLKEHINFASEQVTAAKKNDSRALKIADAKLHKNADQMSAFLSSANPNITNADMKAMLYDHLKLLTDVVVARLKKQYPQDVTSFDAYRLQLNDMADHLAAAIIAQQRDKFR